MSITVNYDQLAATYNQRFSGDSQSGVLSFLLELANRLQAHRILEVGCGAGHWLEGLTQNLPAGIDLYGPDRSDRMLVQAKQAGLTLPLLRGLAGDLPFPNAKNERRRRKTLIF
jgi:ubiquinone/menaquinone biosynthesis C-methylase UbiE